MPITAPRGIRVSAWIAILAVVFTSGPAAADWDPALPDIGEGIGEALETVAVVAVISAGATAAISGGMAYWNRSKVKSDDPSRATGVFGTVWGGITTAWGAAFISAERGGYVLGGIMVCAGAASIYYGVQDIRAVSRKARERQRTSWSIEPAIIPHGTKAADIGLKVSIRF